MIFKIFLTTLTFFRQNIIKFWIKFGFKLGCKLRLVQYTNQGMEECQCGWI